MRDRYSNFGELQAHEAESRDQARGNTQEVIRNRNCMHIFGEEKNWKAEIVYINWMPLGANVQEGEQNGYQKRNT